MKIENPKPISATGGPTKADAARTRAGDVGASSRASASGPAITDRVEIGAATELFDLVALVSGMPEPPDETEVLRAAVRNGSYEPNLRSLAERLVDHAALRDALGSD